METKEIIHLLRHQRHDVMNHLQIVQGYLSMGKTDKVQHKIADLINIFHNERKLINLGTDQFTLWVILFNTKNKNIRLTYDIHIENRKLDYLDPSLLKWSQHLIYSIHDVGENDELYEVELVLSEGKDESVCLQFSITGIFDKVDKLKENLQDLGEACIQILENRVICTIQLVE